MKTKSKITLFVMFVIIVGSLVGGYLAVVHVPDWYEPVYVTAVDQQKLRDDLTSITTKFNNQMQHPDAFEFTISEDEINRLIAGLGYLDPRLNEAIPSQVDRPAVKLSDDALKLGAVVEQDGRKVFASFEIKLSAVDDLLILQDLQAHVGLVPIPRQTLMQKFSEYSDRLGKYLPFMESIAKEGKCENRFPYPNGGYDFRIRDLRANNGKLSMRIVPIAREKNRD